MEWYFVALIAAAAFGVGFLAGYRKAVKNKVIGMAEGAFKNVFRDFDDQ